MDAGSLGRRVTSLLGASASGWEMSSDALRVEVKGSKGYEGEKVIIWKGFEGMILESERLDFKGNLGGNDTSCPRLPFCIS